MEEKIEINGQEHTVYFDVANDEYRTHTSTRDVEVACSCSTYCSNCFIPTYETRAFWRELQSSRATTNVLLSFVVGILIANLFVDYIK